MRTNTSIHFSLSNRIFVGDIDRWSFGHYFGAIAVYLAVGNIFLTILLGVVWELFDLLLGEHFDPWLDARGFDITDVAVDSLGALTIPLIIQLI